MRFSPEVQDKFERLWDANRVAMLKRIATSQNGQHFTLGMVDPLDESVRFCVKCGHSDVGHGKDGCKGGSCLCWLTDIDMQFEKNLEQRKN